MTSKLLPCPFCGELPVITKHFKHDIYSFMHRCSVIGPIYRDFRESEQGHIDMWNTRAAPLSPDHSGGAGNVVLPVVWRIPVNGEWFYGTKEQCEREYAEYTADFAAEDFDEDGPAKPEPLACLDKVKELNQ